MFSIGTERIKHHWIGEREQCSCSSDSLSSEEFDSMKDLRSNWWRVLSRNVNVKSLFIDNNVCLFSLNHFQEEARQHFSFRWKFSCFVWFIHCYFDQMFEIFIETEIENCSSTINYFLENFQKIFSFDRSRRKWSLYSKFERKPFSLTNVFRT